jgi:hypothetical protein
MLEEGQESSHGPSQGQRGDIYDYKIIIYIIEATKKNMVSNVILPLFGYSCSST